MPSIKYKFRWPIKPIGPNEVEVQIPTGPNGINIIDPDAADKLLLSKGELEAAEAAALKAVAIVQ